MASVRKLDPKDPDSPWVVDYTDAAGKRRRRTPKSGLKKDADAIRLKIEREIEDREHHPRSQSATVAQVCDMFMKHTDQRVADRLVGRSRREQLLRIVRLHIVPHIGAKVFSELTVLDIEKWFAVLSSKPNCSRASRGIYLEALRVIEQFALRRGFTVRKPVASLKLERGATAKEKIKTLTAKDIGAILKAAEHRPSRWRYKTHSVTRAAIHLAAFCGLRRGEIFGLTLDDVDLQRRVIHVRHSLTQFNEHKGPKSKAGIRDVPMPSHIALLLADYRDRFYADNERKLFFTSLRDDRYRPEASLHTNWREVLERAGLYDGSSPKSYHFHALRHFAASWMIQNGLAPPDVARLLGHETFDMTLQVYAHPTLDAEHRHTAIQSMATNLIDVVTAEGSDTTKTRLPVPSA